MIFYSYLYVQDMFIKTESISNYFLQTCLIILVAYKNTKSSYQIKDKRISHLTIFESISLCNNTNQRY